MHKVNSRHTANNMFCVVNERRRRVSNFKTSKSETSKAVDARKLGNMSLSCHFLRSNKLALIRAERPLAPADRVRVGL